MHLQHTDLNEDFITIIGHSLDEIMQSYHEQGLAEKRYIILHRTGRHSFKLSAEGNETQLLFDGQAMIAATFVRRDYSSSPSYGSTMLHANEH